METTSSLSREDQDRIASTGDRPVRPPDNSMEQPLSPQDERIVSANNPSPDAAAVARPTTREGTMNRPEPSDAAGDSVTGVHSFNLYAPNDQNLFYGGYDSGTGNWDGYHHFHADGLHVIPPVIYNDNPSILFHSGYGFNSELPYGQYSPVATPLPPMMIENHMYPSQQLPFPANYYPQGAPSGLQPTAVQVSPTELVNTENATSDAMIFGPGSGYLLHFGSFGGGNLPVNTGYHPSTGILGPYEQNVGQMLPQHQTFHGQGSAPSSTGGVISPIGSYQFSNFGGTSASYTGGNDQRQLSIDKGRRRDRDRNDSRDFSIDHNRGPRASKPRGRSNGEGGFSSGSQRNGAAASGNNVDSYNRPDFVTDYKNAKFFIIKSFSEDNVHKSIKYNVWASTPHGNKKLDASYREAKEKEGDCPVFLFFSVNGSGQFCGLAEMIGPVDFEKDADYWQLDRWNGQFPVKWHIIKDVPNNRFRHILLENNDNKPVTHSRDSQEVKLEHGIEMLKIFKDHDYRTSILDDFDFYDEREKAFKERKARQQAASTSGSSNALEESVAQISDSFSQSLQLQDNSEVKVEAGTSSLQSDAPVSYS